MKYLLIVVLVLAVIWFVRRAQRNDAGRGEAQRRGPAAGPQDMVQCSVCSVHLPRTDALPGPDGRLYCCAEHRVRGE